MTLPSSFPPFLPGSLSPCRPGTRMSFLEPLCTLSPSLQLRYDLISPRADTAGAARISLPTVLALALRVLTCLWRRLRLLWNACEHRQGRGTTQELPRFCVTGHWLLLSTWDKADGVEVFQPWAGLPWSAAQEGRCGAKALRPPAPAEEENEPGRSTPGPNESTWPGPGKYTANHSPASMGPSLPCLH